MDGDPLERHLLALDAVVSRTDSLARIDALEQRTGGLIARATLAKVLLAEAGLIKRSSAALASITGRTMIDAKVTVKRVFETRRSATEPSVKLDVTDGTRPAKLELRGAHVGLADSRRIGPGSTLALVNIEATLSGTTLELTAGGWSKVDLSPAQPADKRPSSISAGEAGVSLRGQVTAFSEPRSFMRPEGGAGFVCEVSLDCEGEAVTVTLWDGAAKVAQKLTVGERISLDGLYAKERNGRVTINSSRSTEIVFLGEGAIVSSRSGSADGADDKTSSRGPPRSTSLPDPATRSL